MALRLGGRSWGKHRGTHHELIGGVFGVTEGPMKCHCARGGTSALTSSSWSGSGLQGAVERGEGVRALDWWQERPEVGARRGGQFRCRQWWSAASASSLLRNGKLWDIADELERISGARRSLLSSLMVMRGAENGFTAGECWWSIDCVEPSTS